MPTIELHLDNDVYPIKYNPSIGVWGYLSVHGDMASLVNVPLIPARLKAPDQGLITRVLNMLAFPAIDPVLLRPYLNNGRANANPDQKFFMIRENPFLQINTNGHLIRFSSDIKTPNHYEAFVMNESCDPPQGEYPLDDVDLPPRYLPVRHGRIYQLSYCFDLNHQRIVNFSSHCDY